MMAMVPKTGPSGEGRLVLVGVPWRTYERALRTFADRHVRITYDRGEMEIMTLSHEHESHKYLLSRFIDALTEELGLPIKGGGSTTFRVRRRRRGIEPDNCYWVANEPLVRGKLEIDLRTDPAPDLALEIDVTHSSLDRLAIYATLRVPEVWRYDGQTVVFHVLGKDGRSTEAAISPTFPFLKPEDIVRFLALRTTMDENAVVREFRAWVR